MAPTIGVNLRVTGHCNQGGRKYMEDAFVVAYQQTRDVKDLEYAFFGIFDGHGGREAALFAKEHLMDTIVSQKNFWSENDELVLKAIRDGFITTHLAMWKEVGKWPKTVSGLPSTSGTTSSVAFIRRGKLYIGHVGDSKIVLGYQEPGDRTWLPLPLTKDHKPESPKEKKRIYSVGGLVMNKAGVERVVWNRPRIGHKGPIRRSTPFDQIPFLAVARSLGDLWSYNYLRREFVVSPEPDVSVFTLDPRRDRCIILASDGLWNMVSARTAVTVVQNAEEQNEQMILEGGGADGVGKPSKNPSKLLVDKALQYWYDLRMRADNTSVVTVLLDPPGPPKSEVLLRQKIMQKLRPRDEQGELENQSLGPTDIENNEAKSSRKRSNSTDNSNARPSLEMTPVQKEKKFGLSDYPVDGLPKPVILSPQRVHVRRTPVSLDKQKRHSPEKVPDVGVGKSLDETKKESVGALPVEQKIENQEKLPEQNGVHHESATALGECPEVETKGSTASTRLEAEQQQQDQPQKLEVPVNGENTQTSLPACSSKNTNLQNGTASVRESGRMHLSVVDNIVASDNVENRLREQLRPVAGVEENENKSTEENALLLRSPEDSRSSSALKRRSQMDDEAALTPSKNPRLGGGSWFKDSSPSCSAVASTMDITHNTRSRQLKRKVKVR